MKKYKKKKMKKKPNNRNRNIGLAILVATLMIVLVGAAWTPALNVDLIAYYPLNATANDNLGNFDGINSGADTTVPGIISTGFGFDGVADFTNLTIEETFHDYTISFWINTSNISGTQFSYAPLQSENAGGGLQIIGFFYGNSFVTMHHRNTGVTGVNALATTNTSDGAYHHIVGRKEGTNISIWVDGVFEDAATMSDGKPIDVACSIFIGGRNTCGTGLTLPFQADLDEIGIWNRSLTDAEIVQLFNGGGWNNTNPRHSCFIE